MTQNNILYIGGFELPNKNAAAHRVVANAKILRELGYEVTLVGVDKNQPVGSGVIRMEEDFFGFECWSMPYPEGRKAWLYYILGLPSLLLFVLNRLAGCFSVITYNFPAIAQYRIFRLCKRASVLPVADVTEWYDASGGSLLFRVVKWADTSFRMYLVNMMSSGVFTTSRFMSDFYSSRGLEVVELPTLFSTSEFGPPVISKLNIKRFVYVGSLLVAGRVNSKRTNLKERLDVIVQGFYDIREQAPPFRFDIYGIDEKTYLEVFPEHRSIVHDLASSLFFHGVVSNDVARKVISESDFSIFIRDETRVTLAGFPSKFAESISLGTPVVTNRMKSLSSYEDLDFVFLSEGELSKCLLECLSIDQVEISEIKMRAYQSNIFDYRKYSQQVNEFYRRIANG